jgi:hypothetical protein
MGSKFRRCYATSTASAAAASTAAITIRTSGRINVLYHETLGGNYVPRAVLFNF